jgi:hypothetical protein
MKKKRKKKPGKANNQINKHIGFLFFLINEKRKWEAEEEESSQFFFQSIVVRDIYILHVLLSAHSLFLSIIIKENNTLSMTNLTCMTHLKTFICKS